ncbi:MAG: hypothetical protein D6710_01835 [Nitrospirae bacterium]|nr:MAG: hypothetical protein D6710_01835 [Nitrospirota bacterium]
MAATFEAVLPEIPINSRNIVGATITFSGDARLIFKYENADLTYTEDKEAFIVNNLIESNLQIDNIHYITATGRARDIRFISGMPDFNIDGVGTGGRRFIIPGSIFGVKSFNQEVAALLAAGTVLHGELDTYSSLVTEDLTWVIYIANAGNYKVNIIYYYI